MIYNSQFTGAEIDARLAAVTAMQTAIGNLETALAAKYSKPDAGIPETDLDADVQAALTLARNAVQDLSDYYTKAQIDDIVAAIGSSAGVVVASLPAASSGTLGKIYYVGPDANGFYDRYVTTYDGGVYSWLSIGNTEVDMTQYATKEEVQNLENTVNGYEAEGKVVKDVSSISYVSRYIKASDNTWNSGNNSRGIFVPVTPGKKYGILYTNLNAEASTTVAVVRDASITIGTSVNYATGFGRQLVVVNDEYVFTAPEDAAYVFMMIRYGSTTAFQYTVYEYYTYHVEGVEEKVADIQPKTATLWAERNARQIAFPVDTYAWSNNIIESGATFRNSYYIRVAEGTWNSGADYLSTRLPVFDARRVAVTPGEYGRYYIAFLKDATYSINATASFCDGYGSVITGTESAEYTIPADCKYLYVFNTYNETAVTPSAIILYYDKTEAMQRRRPIVSFIDDDGQKTQLQWLEPIVEQTGVSISIALITAAVGNTNYCTWDELRRWRNMGFSFVGHMGTRITEYTPEELALRFEAIQVAMEAHGMLDSNLFVLPNGSWDATSKAVVAQYFEASFNTTARVNAPPISDRYLLRRVPMDQGPTMLDAWKGWVDNAIQTRGWVIFYSHARGDVYTEEMRAAYIELINYCKGKGVDILSVPDGWKYYKQFI